MLLAVKAVALVVATVGATLGGALTVPFTVSKVGPQVPPLPTVPPFADTVLSFLILNVKVVNAV
jgi:hypothetical protein